MDDFKPDVNRFENEKSRRANDKESEIKKIDSVVKGKVKTVKKSQNDGKSLFAMTITDAASNLYDEVIKPMAVKAFVNIIEDGLHMWAFGNIEKKDDRHKGLSYVSYDKSYDRHRRDTRTTTRRSVYDYDDIILDTRAEAMEVLDRMDDLIDRYRTASVADLYQLVGVTPNHTDYKYGWTSLRHADISRTRDGGYMLKMPRAMELD